MKNPHDGDPFCQMHGLGINECVFDEQRIGICGTMDGQVCLSTYQKGVTHVFPLSPAKARHLAALLTECATTATPPDAA